MRGRNNAAMAVKIAYVKPSTATSPDCQSQELLLALSNYL
jgi:hypothetical protein